MGTDSGDILTPGVTNAAGVTEQPTPADPAIPLAPPDKQPPDLKVPRAEKKARYAIVGLGRLALDEVMPAFGEAARSTATALVSGHSDKAAQVAAAYGIRPDGLYTYDTYDRIAKDDQIDIVYIILPNSMHAEYTIRALEAGKHVLCEKPMAVSARECERMIAAAKASNRKLMIAYRLHYEPFNQKVMELCKERALGRVKTFVSSNCQNTKAPNIRLSTALGGGPVSDTGIYSINAARYVIGEEPMSVTAFAHSPSDDPRFREVPESVAFTLRYPSGVVAHCDTSFGTSESRFFRVHCAEGAIYLDGAFGYRGQRLMVMRGAADTGGIRREELQLRAVNHFAAEMDHFSECVLDDKPVKTPGEMGLADVRIIEAIHESVREAGRPIALRSTR